LRIPELLQLAVCALRPPPAAKSVRSVRCAILRTEPSIYSAITLRRMRHTATGAGLDRHVQHSAQF
jgi:hypothetical protein